MSTATEPSFCTTSRRSLHQFKRVSSTSSDIVGFRVFAYIINLVIISGSNSGIISPRLTFMICFAMSKSCCLLGWSLIKNISPNLDMIESGSVMFSLIDNSGSHLLFFGLPAAIMATLTSHVISIPIFLRLNFCDSIIS